jgi:hypothetical protein
MMRAFAFLLATASLFAAGCRYDPVPQQIIDDLGPEQGTPSATHRPGQPCLVCHSNYEGAAPPFAVAGTIFNKKDDGTVVPAVGVKVIISDSAAGLRKACTNAAGNFFVKREDWVDITFPLSAQSGSRGMSSLIGRDGSCASCHKLPDKASEDPVTGAAHGSPGMIFADPLAIGATEGCGSPQ